jgi:hypothetical protein
MTWDRAWMPSAPGPLPDCMAPTATRLLACLEPSLRRSCGVREPFGWTRLYVLGDEKRGGAATARGPDRRKGPSRQGAPTRLRRLVPMLQPAQSSAREAAALNRRVMERKGADPWILIRPA